MTCKEMVTEFHKLNGSVINGRNNGPEVAVLRMRLIIEEFAETYAALHENNVVEVADGLTDLLYVIYGTAVSYGLACPDVHEEPLGQPATTFERSDILRFGQMILPRLQRVYVALRLTPYASGPAITDLAEEIWTAGARTWGFPMDKLFAEVHRSNMTKTFSPTSAGDKYGPIKSKGPDYSVPDIAGILCIKK